MSRLRETLAAYIDVYTGREDVIPHVTRYPTRPVHRQKLDSKFRRPEESLDSWEARDRASSLVCRFRSLHLRATVDDCVVGLGLSCWRCSLLISLSHWRIWPIRAVYRVCMCVRTSKTSCSSVRSLSVSAVELVWSLTCSPCKQGLRLSFWQEVLRWLDSRELHL